MDRRVFLGVVVGALPAVPLAVSAQPASRKVPLVGLLDFAAPDPGRLGWWQALRDRLQELGYVEGRTIAFETRWAEGQLDRLPGLAVELVRLKVDLIVTGGGETARAAQQMTATIPIVMATGADPVRLGVVRSLGRPGGNVTGVTSLSAELIAKLPTAVGGREYAEAGGLFSSAVSYPDLCRRAAAYVDKILRGAKPANLPVEQPTKFELVLNLRTAKALGLTIPPSLLVRADQVIE